MTLGSKSALEKAKSNVEKAFPVVGILEDLVTTFKVMEKILPHFFAGVQNVYQEDLKGDEGGKFNYLIKKLYKIFFQFLIQTQTERSRKYPKDRGPN